MKRLFTISLISLSFTAAWGEEIGILPSGYPASRYTAIWENSPFNREVIKAVEQSITSNFAQSLTLEGIVTDDNLGPIAYVRDMTSNQPIVITRDKSDSHPYTIVSANMVKNPEATKVTITDGNESGEIGYVITKLNQPIEQFQQPQQKPQIHPSSKKEQPLPTGGAFPAQQGVPGAGIPADPATLVKPQEAEKTPATVPVLGNPDEVPRSRRAPVPVQ